MDWRPARWPGFERFGRGLRAALALLVACVIPVSELGLAPVASAAAPIEGHAAESAESYRLQPGDEISIAVLPQKTYDCGGVVLPDGLLTLKNVGSVKASGLTLAELAAEVKRALEQKLVAPRVTVTIVSLHPVTELPEGRVIVTGAVAKPGMQPLGKGMRVRRALELAGVSLSAANLTQVVILRMDLSRVVVDISTPDLVSDPAHNVVLQNGDLIEVPPIVIRTATVLGAVLKPGQVELGKGIRVHKALELAGGVLKEGDRALIEIRHRDLTQKVVDLSEPDRVMDPELNPFVADGDTITVPTKTMKVPQVAIRGQVLNGNRYDFREEMTLEDLIGIAGKLTPLADTERIELHRPWMPVQVISLKEQKRLGLMGDIALQPDDEVFIPEQKETILLLGAVPRPGKVGLKSGQTLIGFFTQGTVEAAELLDPARVDLGDVRLIRDGKETMKVNVLAMLTKPGSKNKDVPLRSGDVIYLPPMIVKGQKRSPLDYVGYLTQIKSLGSKGVGSGN